MSTKVTMAWPELFGPVSAQGRDLREGQALLGQAVLDAIANSTSLIAEAGTGTGKSFATLIPCIHAAQLATQARVPFKAVVSTETLTLQGQLIDKDLPFLATLYGDFTYRKLMGRSNYLCLNQARINSRGSMEISGMVEKLDMRISDIGDGELRDIERVLHRELAKDQWDELTGSSKFCGDNQCAPEKCFGAQARAKAMVADIVVVNHAILATDIEMKTQSGGGVFADGILGPIDVLVVDEAHKLEPVFVSQWTKELTDWELREQTAAVLTGIDRGRMIVSNSSVGDKTTKALLDVEDVLKNIQKFYMEVSKKEGVEWKKASQAICEKLMSNNDPARVLDLMREYEEDNPIRLEQAEQQLETTIKYLTQVTMRAADEQSLGRRKINKGLRAAKDLIETVKILKQAIGTKDGIVSSYGIFGASVDGWVRQNGDPGMTIRLVPLDISPRAKMLWKSVVCPIMVSATLTDHTDGTLNYARECVGFPDGAELKVGTPFDLMNQQLVYVTGATGSKADVGRAEFSMEELAELIDASNGRALALFTAREELDWAASQMKSMAKAKGFKHKILVQEKDSNKNKLADEFKSDVHSSLFATKSFFTGFDAPGETLSLLVMCKFPLPRYSVECRQQIAHWRRRGFHNWYTRASLTDLEQAFGRLIRSSGCKGVLAMLDFRAMDTGSSVYKAAHLGISSTGSPVTQDINYVRQFLAS